MIIGGRQWYLGKNRFEGIVELIQKLVVVQPLPTLLQRQHFWVSWQQGDDDILCFGWYGDDHLPILQPGPIDIEINQEELDALRNALIKLSNTAYGQFEEQKKRGV